MITPMSQPHSSGAFVLLTGTHDLCKKMLHKLNNSPLGPRIETGIEPLLSVEHRKACDIDQEIAAIQPTCLVVTSAQVLRYLESSNFDRSLPVWAIGVSTTDALRRLGFQKIFTGDGGARELFSNLAKTLSADRAPSHINGYANAHNVVLYLSGEDIAFDMPGALRELGITVHQVVTYTTHASTSLSAATLQRLQLSIQQGQDIWLLLFSPKAAKSLKTMCYTCNYTALLPSIYCLALSRDILDEVNELPFKSQVFSEQPRLQSLLISLEQRLIPAMPPSGMRVSEEE